MTDRDQAVRYPVNGDHDRPGQFPAFTEFTVTTDQPADVAAGLVSLGYIWAAIKRGKRLWCTLAVIGLVVGSGVFLKHPPPYKAETSVLLTYGSDENPATAVLDNQAIAESHTVARLAMNEIGDHQSVGSFAASYVVAVVTDRVLLITASAPSSGQAVSRASAIATQFLKLRANLELNAQKVLVQALELEVGPDRQKVASLSSQITRVGAETASSARLAKLNSLHEQKTQASLSLSVLEETIAGDESGGGTLPSVTGSVVLDPAAPLLRSKVKAIALYPAYGLIGGLALGLGIVVIWAVGSDRLRRRDDIARALRAPVKLSVGDIRLGRKFATGKRALHAAEDINIQRIVAHLREAVPPGQERIAIVPVDDHSVAAAALSAVSLAESYALDGREVLLADLASGAPIAALFGNEGAGVRVVKARQAHLLLAAPEPDDFAPRGPFVRSTVMAKRSRFTGEAANALRSADVFVTLATLDPAFGGEHLATWADSAVALVTAGRSSWTRLQSVGEMTRMAGTPLISAVLVGADKSDWSLGLTPDPDALAGIGGLS